MNFIRVAASTTSATRRYRHIYCSLLYRRPFSSGGVRDKKALSRILQEVRDGRLCPSTAEEIIQEQPGLFHEKITATATTTPEETLSSFANLDYSRTSRTGFPEVVFGAGKTPHQIAKILDDMARNFNERMIEDDTVASSSQRAILATRVTPDLFEKVKECKFHNGRLEYHEVAQVIFMIPSSLYKKNTIITKQSSLTKRIIIATAGTTDLPVAEEAAIVLEAAQCNVERICDVGVAGLHRILKVLPKLQDPNVGCVIVCAGMDGALPSVVGGLVSCPVIAVPTSIGYGVSLGGISAMLTMLNSCAPGVAVMNIDNGFGAAAFAYKCVTT